MMNKKCLLLTIVKCFIKVDLFKHKLPLNYHNDRKEHKGKKLSTVMRHGNVCEVLPTNPDLMPAVLARSV